MDRFWPFTQYSKFRSNTVTKTMKYSLKEQGVSAFFTTKLTDNFNKGRGYGGGGGNDKWVNLGYILQPYFEDGGFHTPPLMVYISHWMGRAGTVLKALSVPRQIIYRTPSTDMPTLAISHL